MQTTQPDNKDEVLRLLRRTIHLARGWSDDRLAVLLRRAIIRVRLQTFRRRIQRP